MINQVRPMLIEFQKKYYKFVSQSAKLDYVPTVSQQGTWSGMWPASLVIPNATFEGYFTELTDQEIAEFMLEKL
jgi:hypothetical protein